MQAACPVVRGQLRVRVRVINNLFSVLNGGMSLSCGAFSAVGCICFLTQLLQRWYPKLLSVVL